MSVLPDTSIYFDDMTVIGLVLTSFGAAMRDPVTMISVRAVSDGSAAAGVCCARAGTPASASAAATSIRRH